MADTNCTSKFIIYGLRDPRDGALRYIGQSTRGMLRPNEHFSESRVRKEKTHKGRWVLALVKAGLLPRIQVLEECVDLASLNTRERAWIAITRSRGDRLTNLTDGGDGSPGYKPTAEVRAKISKSKESEACRAHLAAMTAATRRPVIDQDGKLYASSADAARAIGSSGTLVRQSIKGKVVVLAGGYGFRYADDPAPRWRDRREWEAWVSDRRQEWIRNESARARNQQLGTVRPEISKVRAAQSCRKVVSDQFGTIYPSVGAAAKAIGVGLPTVSSVLSGRYKHAKGYTFTFVPKEQAAAYKKGANT